MDKQKLLVHNSNQVAKWFEYRDPTIQKGTAGSYFSLEADRRSESRVPMSERGHKSLVCSENAHFRRHVLPILTRIQHQEIFKPAKFLEHDPTALRRWRAGETLNDKRQMEKFNRLCKFVAMQLDRAWPGLRVFFVINPEDEEVADRIHQRNKDNNALRSHGARESYRKIDADIKQIMETEQCTVEAAIGLYRDRLERANEEDVSPRKIKMARAFVKDEAAIKAIVKEKGCTVETAIEVHELRKEDEKCGAA